MDSLLVCFFVQIFPQIDSFCRNTKLNHICSESVFFVVFFLKISRMHPFGHTSDLIFRIIIFFLLRLERDNKVGLIRGGANTWLRVCSLSGQWYQEGVASLWASVWSALCKASEKWSRWLTFGFPSGGFTDKPKFPYCLDTSRYRSTCNIFPTS